MITYTISPNVTPHSYNDKHDKYQRQGVKEILPLMKGYLHFVTSDEYLNLESSSKYSQELFQLGIQDLSDLILIRANSVVQYECGIKLRNVGEVKDLIKNLKMTEDCSLLAGRYTSEHHLKHQVQGEHFTETKQLLMDTYNFPQGFRVDNKNFELNQIGVDLSNSQLTNPQGSGGKHIQIMYVNTNNNGYMKFKKPDNPAQGQNIDDISPNPEYDYICVNIHFKISHNKKYSPYTKQLQKIGTQFQLATGMDKDLTNTKLAINGCDSVDLQQHFKTLQQHFKTLYEIAFVKDYQTCKSLNDEVIPLGIGSPSCANVNFDNKIEPFLDFTIFSDKLEAPENLEILLVGSDSSEESV